MKTLILVATTKPYRMPNSAIYLPVQVGAAGKASIGYARDDSGENISTKNANYCELTGLYWAWKNWQVEAVGLVHYRRHFGHHGIGDKFARVLNEQDVEKLLTQADIVVAKKRHYYIETNESQYAHAHHGKDLQSLRACIAEQCPTYLPSFETVMRRRSGHRFNTLIMKKAKLDAYCTWLFALLADMEKRVDLSTYDPYQARVFGYLAERLLDVWLLHNHEKVVEQTLLYMEKQNWALKIGKFVHRKYRGIVRKKRHSADNNNGK